MNILHISRTMGQGGAEKIVYQLCKAQKDGTNQFVISCGGSYVKELESLGVKHVQTPDMDSKNPIIMLQCLFLIGKMVRREHIDILHTHHRMAAFYARLVSMVYHKVKCIYTAHNIFQNKRKLLQFALKHTKVIAVGESVKENLVQFYGLPEERVQVIYNSVEIRAIDVQNYNQQLELYKNKGMYLIGNIGRISRQKGMDVFVRALSQSLTDYPNLMGVIIGDGEERLELEELVKELEMEGHICFLGFQRNVYELITQLDFCVLSSRWEGFPLTPIEVFAMGKTIVASDIPGTSEIVGGGWNGLLFEKDDISGLSEKINYMIEHEEEKEVFEKNAFQTFQDKFSYDIFLRKYQQVYEEWSNC